MRPPFKQRTWELLEIGNEKDRASRFFDYFIFTLILLNVGAFIIGTVPAVNETAGGFLHGFEIFSIVIFTVEYFGRVWSCVTTEKFRNPVTGRIRFSMTPLAVIDLLAILPFYLAFLGIDLRFLRILRIVRILRIAKLSRYLEGLMLFADVLRNRKEELIMTTTVLMVLLIVSSSMMYYAEVDAQPEAFTSIPATMWWAVATLTTVGYGDIYPITALGKIFGSMVAVIGIGLFALPTAILGSGFIEEINKRKEKQNCPYCGKALGEDGSGDRSIPDRPVLRNQSPELFGGP